jgi:opacity protein-like surface antigen
VNKWFFSAIVLMTSLAVFAAPKTRKAPAPAPTPQMSVHDEALKENSSIDVKAYKKTIQASEAQQADVQSFLKLQDPAPELRNRPWFWSFAFKLQSFKPMGVGSVSTSTYGLDSYGTSVMPSIELGFMVPAIQKDSWSWASGMALHGGYTVQQTNLVTASGFSYNNTRLSSAMLSLIWNNRFGPAQSRWSFLLNPEVGVINYTQTASQNSEANFTQQNGYLGVGLGVDYSLTKKWGLLAQYNYRQANASKSDITDVQKNTFEIGTSVIW